MQKLMLASGLAAVGLFAVGCDTANSATKSAASSAKAAAATAEKAADKATDMAAKAGDAAKEAVVKPVESMYEKVEEKIKGLSGDAMTKAKAKFDEVKKLVLDFKASPADGMAALKDKLTAAVAELKTMVGL